MTDKAKKLGEIKWTNADIRTVIAAMAMQGMINDKEFYKGCPNTCAVYAIQSTDALLEELAKEEEK